MDAAQHHAAAAAVPRLGRPDDGRRRSRCGARRGSAGGGTARGALTPAAGTALLQAAAEAMPGRSRSLPAADSCWRSRSLRPRAVRACSCGRARAERRAAAGIGSQQRGHATHVLTCPAGTCRLSWYTSPPPQFGNTILCNGSSTDSCFQPCMAGYEQLHNSSLCLQKCPDKAAGPAHLCPISRTCIRSEGACPVLSDVPFFCTVPDQFMGERGAGSNREQQQRQPCMPQAVLAAATLGARRSPCLLPCSRSPMHAAGGCAKQSYQAVPATHQLEPPCSGTAYRDHTGGWRCTEGQQQQAPCSPGFANMSAVVLGVGARCTQVRSSSLVLALHASSQQLPACRASSRLRRRCTCWLQVCPPWLVDCGEACHMPGVPCIQSPEHLCPIAPLAGVRAAAELACMHARALGTRMRWPCGCLSPAARPLRVAATACNLSERSASALAAACQSEGFHGTGGCPLTLRLHGSCGGSRLQVAAGLRSAGFLRKLEAWWGPVVGAEPLPDNYDGPLRAVRLTFAHKKQTVVRARRCGARSWRMLAVRERPLSCILLLQPPRPHAAPRRAGVW